MNWRKLKSALGITTNIAVLVAAAALIFVLARGYFGSERGGPPVSPPPGTRLANIEGVDYSGARRTLILALNTGCGFCTKSVPFYQRLVEAQSLNDAGTQLVALFPNTAEDTNKYLQQQHLTLRAIPNVDFSTINVDATPTLIAIDDGGKIVNSWVGRLSNEVEQEVLRAMGLTALASEERAQAPLRVDKTVDVFDEHRALLSIQPDVQAEHEVLRFINLFDVDGKGNVYLIVNGSLIKYDLEGSVAGATTLLPFKGSFCVDAEGNVYFPTETGLSVYSASLKPSGDVSLPNLFSGDSAALKMAFDRAHNFLYLQVYRSEPLEQVLYRWDPKTQEVKTIFRLENPVRFTPAYAPGAFDFAIGKKYLYVSDIREYKIYLYSLQDGLLTRAYSKPFSPQPIDDEDGELVLRRMKIAGLRGSGLDGYPPIFHLNATGDDHVLVWTSRRDHELRQVVDVYDAEMRFIGTDVKYAHPQRSNYVFANGKVYVPDFGFGQAPQNRSLSPLEIPAKPFALKVFEESLSGVKTAVKNPQRRR